MVARASLSSTITLAQWTTSSSEPARSAARSARGSRATGTTCSSATPIAEHVAAINEHGLALEGPVERVHRRGRPRCSPDGLPDGSSAVLLAVKAQHTDAALDGDRAPARARTASSSRSRTASTSPLIASIGRRGADGRRVRQLRRRLPRARAGSSSAAAARSTSASSTAAPSERVERLLRRPAGREGAPATSSASSGRRRRTARCCSRPRSPTSRSPTRSPSRATAALFVRLAREVLAAAPVPRRSRSTASTPTTSTARSTGSSSSTAARRRRTPASTAT